MNVSRETEERLTRYSDLLRHWSSRINLVSPADMSNFRLRHLSDCLQLANLAPEKVDTWADLGSGGGLPGLVMAIAYGDKVNHFVLVESDQRKATFLRQAVRELGLENVTVLARRIEVVEPLNADVVSARALAPLPTLMAYLKRHLSTTGQAFLFKGRQWQSEVEDARREWSFDYRAHPSTTQDGAAVLEISGVSHATA